MKRAVLAIAGTVTALVLLLGFKTHPTAIVGGSTTVLSTSAPSPTAAPSPATASQPSRSPTQSPSPVATTRTITGDTADTPYGPVQVRVTLTGGTITAIDALQLPSDRQRSREIASYSVPQLEQEARAAQSAHIDMVSGATYTSEGYAASLQSALDQAGSR